MRVAACLLTLLLTTSVGPHLLAAQATGTIVGTVVDETTGEPLAGARLSVPGTQTEAVSDEEGIFELTPVGPGDIAVRVELPGWAAVVEQIEVLPDEVGLFQFRLSRVEVALQGLIVRARADDGHGAAISDVEPSGGFEQTAFDLLREQIPGVAVRSRFGAGAGIRIRGASSLVNNDPVLYIDGVLIADAGGVSVVNALEQIPAERVQRIRVLHGPAAAARYGDATRGVILVETR
jgi:hypothetical protein